MLSDTQSRVNFTALNGIYDTMYHNYSSMLTMQSYLFVCCRVPVVFRTCCGRRPSDLSATKCELSHQRQQQFASVQKQVAILEDSQLCHGTRMDEHDEALMQQQEKLQEVDETLKRFLR